ncbi:MAG: histidinol dehydrogenase, partial [Phycisphaerales bacterium]|nr:histidinol dehydrogenase [Phycisphaerales bacterium]
DETADPAIVASDLLAQAEHDTDALPMLVATDAALADAVDREIETQSKTLATADVATVAVGQGFTCVVDSIDDAVDLANHLAPEHLEIITRDATGVASRIVNAGGLFIGADAAEVVGDYGAGPNHTLPTGGAARHQAGLSVSHFLRLRTWIEVDDARGASVLFEDARALAALEGLPAHAASAARRS